jgi:PIN domain nuclease of toxin-antitoxin system
MNQILLDTRALVWWLEAKDNLSRKAKKTIEDSETVVFVSAVSGWELAIKTQIGKFKSAELVESLEKEIEKEDSSSCRFPSSTRCWLVALAHRTRTRSIAC